MSRPLRGVVAGGKDGETRRILMLRREADGVAWFLESQGLEERALERTCS